MLALFKIYRVHIFLVVLLLAGLLAACGSDNNTPLPDNLEIIRPSLESGTTEAAPGTYKDEITPVSSREVVQTTNPAANTNVSQVDANPNTTPVTTGSPVTTISALPATSPSPATSQLAVGGSTYPTPSVGVATPSTTATVTQKSALPPLKKGVLLEPMVWEAQTWNNCAPVSALMALSYYGVKVSQSEAGKALRPNGGDQNTPVGDKHVEPNELVGYLQSKGLKTFIRENGSLDQIRALLSAGIPVIMQQWLKEGDDIAHYRVIRGYDLATNVLIFNDSMDRKPNTVVSNADEEKLWKAFDRRYLPVYRPNQEATVKAILGADADEQTNLNRALEAARKFSETSPGDIDAWRNLGFLLYTKGDYPSALKVWEQKLAPMLAPSENGPYNRFLWYQLWPVISYNKVGNYQQVLKMAPNEIEKAKVYSEVRYEYGVALLNAGRKQEAINQLKQAVLDDQNYQPVKTLLDKLGEA